MFIPALYNSAMILYLVVMERGLAWWYILPPIFYLLWVFFDMRVIWRQELNMSVTESEEMSEIKDNVSRILRILTENEE